MHIVTVKPPARRKMKIKWNKETDAILLTAKCNALLYDGMMK